MKGFPDQISGDQVNCPSCNSEKTKRIGCNYPESYECEECNHTFIRARNALTNE